MSHREPASRSPAPILRIHCRKCREPIAGDDILLDAAIAKCRHCGAVFGIHNQLDDFQLHPLPARLRPTLPKPEWLPVEEWGSELTITYRGASWVFGIFGFFFCALWDGAALFGFWQALQGNVAWGELWILIGVSIPFAVIGVYVTYHYLARMCNASVLHFDNGELTARHGPLPYYSDVTLAAKEIDQIYCSPIPAYADPTTRARHLAQKEIHVVALLRVGSRVDLLNGLDDRNLAGYIELKLEEKLKIEDRPMKDEIDWS